MNTTNKKNTKIGIGAGLIVSAIILGIAAVPLYRTFFGTHSVYDEPNKENTKIIPMLDEQIERALNDHTQSTMHPGFRSESRENAAAFLSTIRSIQSYARYGVESTQARNNLELKITFTNGKTVDKVYTGQTVSGFMGPALLMKVYLKDGKTEKVLTNGMEKTGSPDWIINDLYLLIDSAIGYDISVNEHRYFPPRKTQKDFEKEWEEK
ncbi:MAG: hypothetical protein KF704_15410 [Crocinitomicaceae bacterium]|nr:hypothetical protein [Crocinitomicaceae bacterium]